jgi:hemerythrin-like domain-containing protein
MDDLKNDTEIDQPRFFSKLQQILTQLNEKIQENKQAIDSIKNFIEPYTDVEEAHIAKENEAIISVILKDQKTISNLPEFTKNINAWNRILPIYHQVLTSHSPKDIEIIEVQNGSIDFVFSLDVDVALNLVELFKVGFKCYAAYLSYKKIIAPITDAYFGNQKLLKSEKAREEELLNNIALAITSKIEEQHKLALKNDSKIDKNIDKKVEQITNLITAHIIKGNDVKLLAFPTKENETAEQKKEKEESKKELEIKSREVRIAIKELPKPELAKLLKEYGEIKESTTD